MHKIEQEFLQGVQALTNGRYQEAIKHLEQSLKLHQTLRPISGDDHEEVCYFNLGQARKADGDYEQAISEFQKALSLNPRMESAYLALAECCYELETYEAMEIGVDTLKSCTHYFPQNEEVYMNLGIACLKIGRKDEARNAFSNAKRLGNKDVDNFIRQC